MSKLIQMVMDYPVNNTYILTIGNLIVSIVFTLLVSTIMLVTYRFCHDTLTYNKKLNTTLVMLSLITTLLLALIQNNPLLSLGVLGSLSICRIRTNTKDPRDLGFVFWALSIGIASAIGAFVAALISSIMLSCILLVFEMTKRKRHKITMIVRGNRDYLSSVENILHTLDSSSIESKNVSDDTFELVYEMDEKEMNNSSILEKINKMDGISGINVLAPETQIV